MLKLKTFGFAVVLYCASAATFAAAPATVSVVPVTKDVMAPTVMVTGHVQSRFASDVSAGIGGKLVWITEPGTSVQANEIIARIDKRPYQLAVSQLEAQIARKNIELKTAKRDLERMQALLAAQATSRREIDNQHDQVALVEADLALLQLQLEQAQHDLQRTDIKAPFSGVITSRLHQDGADVAPTQALVSLVDLKHLEIRFHGPLSYSDFAALSEQLRVFHSQGNQLLPLRTLIPVSDVRSQTFTGMLSIPEAARHHYRVGELVTVAVPAASPQERHIVPRDAIVYGPGGAHVFVVDEQNMATKISVQVEQGQGAMVAVVGGFTLGQRVVVRGAETLRAGQSVKILTTDEFPLAS